MTAQIIETFAIYMIENLLFQGLHPCKAWNLLKKVHRRAQPNNGFAKALLALDKKLQGKVPMDRQHKRPEVKACPICSKNVGLRTSSLKLHPQKVHKRLSRIDHHGRGRASSWAPARPQQRCGRRGLRGRPTLERRRGGQLSQPCEWSTVGGRGFRGGGARVNESWGDEVCAEMKPRGGVRWAAGGILQKR
jgi:hypothetical protein